MLMSTGSPHSLWMEPVTREIKGLGAGNFCPPPHLWEVGGKGVWRSKLYKNFSLSLLSILSIEITEFSISPFFSFYYLFVPAAYGGSLARGGTGAAAAGLHHSHSNTGSEPPL